MYYNTIWVIGRRWIAITGGRDRMATKDQRRAVAQLGLAIPTVLLEGGARGIDDDVSKRAAKKGWTVPTVMAEWAKFGKMSGFVRNAILVRACDFLVTFGGNSGTRNCVNQAVILGRPVVDLSALLPRSGEDISVELPGNRRRTSWATKKNKRKKPIRRQDAPEI